MTKPTNDPRWRRCAISTEFGESLGKGLACSWVFAEVFGEGEPGRKSWGAEVIGCLPIQLGKPYVLKMQKRGLQPRMRGTAFCTALKLKETPEKSSFTFTGTGPLYFGSPVVRRLKEKKT